MLRSVLLVGALVLPSVCLAEGLATGDQIRAAISGNTVNGSMSASGAYTEYYAADGTIRSADYAGRWSIEGDTMCFVYGEDPATCWGVELSGDQVSWIVNGTVEGSGSIVAGNPNGW
jgi:hypothetical protein